MDQRKQYLRQLRIDAFGDLSNKTVGPFEPGMNVVFGPNESGKSTIAAFTEGVLFGWPAARGKQNAYKPENAERSGSVFFSDGGDEMTKLSRVRNSEGLQGDVSLIEDIDRETFSTMFALDSDELRALGERTEVTNRLLTAGSGTLLSPARALEKVEEELATYTSRAAASQHSLVLLDERRADLRAQVSAASEQADESRAESRELHELTPARARIKKRQSDLNGQIQHYSTQRALLEKYADRQNELDLRLDALHAQRAEAVVRREQALEQATQGGFTQLSAAEEHALRDNIDELQRASDRRQTEVDLAKQAYTISRAEYELLEEAPDLNQAAERARKRHRTQLALSIVLPLASLLLGVPVFVHGSTIASLSISALGLALVLLAFVMAAAGLVMMRRPDHREEEREKQRNDAKWVMMQDEKKLSACERELAQQKERVVSFLHFNGMDEAGGSLRAARDLLDRSRETRSSDTVLGQQIQSLDSQIEETEVAQDRLARQCAHILNELGLEDATLLDTALRACEEEQKDLLHRAEEMNRRYGELERSLDEARRTRKFDLAKQELQEVETRYAESLEAYARLHLERRYLKQSIALWEDKSQPEVYRLASELMNEMTDGKWQQVRMNDAGVLEVVDGLQTAREPHLLSLGTCQQLYLSLRIALLLTADNVGRAMPILADDILVNADSDRRVCIVRALRRLTAQRQVILFTCHTEVLECIEAEIPAVNTVRL